MERFILPWMLLPTSDALLNIRREFAGRGRVVGFLGRWSIVLAL